MEVSRITPGTVLSLMSYLALFTFETCISGWLQTPFVEQDDLKLLVLHVHLLGSQACVTIPVHAEPRFKLGALCVLGQHSTNSPTSVFSIPRRATGRVGSIHFMLSECVHYGYALWLEGNCYWTLEGPSGSPKKSQYNKPWPVVSPSWKPLNK